MNDEEKIIEETLKGIDKEKMAAAFADIFAGSLKQAANNIAALSPQEVEADVKQVALLLSRQKNSGALFGMAKDLNNVPNLIGELAKIVAANEIDLNAAKKPEDGESKIKKQ